MDELDMPKLQDAVRAGKTRAPMERIYQIHEAVAEGRLPNCTSLAKELEVTAKTIQRDISGSGGLVPCAAGSGFC